MKQPPKPFAIEIKRSRRGATPAPPAPMDSFGKQGSTMYAGPSGILSKRDGLSSRQGNSEFVVPFFLQTDKAARTTSSPHLSTEAAQVFGPKPTPAAAESPAPENRAQPRILPSLLPPPGAAQDGGAEGDATPRATRRTRTPEAQALKPRIARSNRAEKIEAATKRYADEGVLSGATDIAKKRGRPASWSAAPAPKGAEAAPTAFPAGNEVENGVASPGGTSRGLRVWSSTRRSRSVDAAALPPGQHWKRRLNPRAW
jgi:hypothetical protein